MVQLQRTVPSGCSTIYLPPYFIANLFSNVSVYHSISYPLWAITSPPSQPSVAGLHLLRTVDSPCAYSPDSRSTYTSYSILFYFFSKGTKVSWQSLASVTLQVHLQSLRSILLGPKQRGEIYKRQRERFLLATRERERRIYILPASCGPGCF